MCVGDWPLNGSTSSVSMASHILRNLRSTLSPIANPSATFLLPISTPSILERPWSPTESIVSTANSVSLRPSSRLHVGSTDGQKAAPAMGSSKMNAIGLLEAHSKMRHDGSPDESGRSSPMSTSTTLRGPRIPHYLLSPLMVCIWLVNFHFDFYSSWT